MDVTNVRSLGNARRARFSRKVAALGVAIGTTLVTAMLVPLPTALAESAKPARAGVTSGQVGWFRFSDKKPRGLGTTCRFKNDRLHSVSAPPARVTMRTYWHYPHDSTIWDKQNVRLVATLEGLKNGAWKAVSKHHKTALVSYGHKRSLKAKRFSPGHGLPTGYSAYRVIEAINWFQPTNNRLEGSAFTAMDNYYNASVIPAEGNCVATLPALPELQSTTLTTADKALTSTTGRKLSLRLVASDGSSPGELDITASNIAANELHRWEVRGVSQGALRANLAKGSGSLSIGNQAAPYAFVSLRFKSTRQAKMQGCDGHYEFRRKVAIRGIASLNTRSTGTNRWGTLGSTTRTINFGTGTLAAEYGTGSCPSVKTCPPIRVDFRAKDASVNADSWEMRSGNFKGKYYRLIGERSVTVGPSDSGLQIQRYDDVLATAQPLEMVHAVDGDKVTVTPTSSNVTSSNASGSITLVGDHPSQGTCGGVTTADYGAQVESGDVLTFDEVFGGFDVAGDSSTFTSSELTTG